MYYNIIIFITMFDTYITPHTTFTRLEVSDRVVQGHRRILFAFLSSIIFTVLQLGDTSYIS